MTKFTDGKILTFEKKVCVSPSGEEPAMRFLIALNIFLSFTALLGNSIILVALKESSLHPASRLLLICLASTDLLVGVLPEPFNVVHLFLSMQGDQHLCSRMLITNYIIGVILFGVSISALTAISVDRLLALLLRLRYRQVVTLKRICAVIAFVWLLNVFFATMYFWVHFIFLWYGYILITVCFITSTSSYTKIYFTLRLHQRQQERFSHEQPLRRTGIPLNIARFRKIVSTALWVQLTFVACYLPYGVVTALMTSHGLSQTIILAGRFASTLVYFNSTLNPLLYCWKIRGVRRTVEAKLQQLMCCGQSRVQVFSSSTGTNE